MAAICFSASTTLGFVSWLSSTKMKKRCDNRTKQGMFRNQGRTDSQYIIVSENAFFIFTARAVRKLGNRREFGKLPDISFDICDGLDFCFRVNSWFGNLLLGFRNLLADSVRHP